MFSHISNDSLSPGHLHLIRVTERWQHSGSSVNVKQLGHQSLFIGRSLHQEQGATVSINHDAHKHKDLVTQAGQIQVVGDVFDELQEELPLVVLLQVVFVVYGGGGVLRDVDPGLQQRGEEVRGGWRERAGFTQQCAPPHAAQRLLGSGVDVLVVSPVGVDGFRPGEGFPQLFLRRSSLQPVASARPAVFTARVRRFLRFRAGVRRSFSGVMVLHPLFHQTCPAFSVQIVL